MSSLKPIWWTTVSTVKENTLFSAIALNNTGPKYRFKTERCIATADQISTFIWNHISEVKDQRTNECTYCTAHCPKVLQSINR